MTWRLGILAVDRGAGGGGEVAAAAAARAAACDGVMPRRADKEVASRGVVRVPATPGGTPALTEANLNASEDTLSTALWLKGALWLCATGVARREGSAFRPPLGKRCAVSESAAAVGRAITPVPSAARLVFRRA